jgi:collagenase-like PrtC family protease
VSTRGRFSVGTNWDDAAVEALESLPDVTDFYGSLPLGVIGHGRPAVTIPGVSRAEALRHIRRIHDAGRTFTYLVNAPSLGGRDMSPSFRTRMLDMLAWVSDAGADAVTLASPALLETIRIRFPNIEAKISHNATVLTVEDALHWERLGASMICLHRCTHRNFPLLSSLAAAVSIPLQVIVTSGCVFGCPNQSSLYHMSITASQSTGRPEAGNAPPSSPATGRAEAGNAPPSPTARHGQGYCFSWCHATKLEHPVELVKSAFIRPEDLQYYEDVGIKNFKLDTRVLDTPTLVARVRAYHARGHDGDFQDLFSAFPLAYRTRVGTQMGVGDAPSEGPDRALAAFQSQQAAAGTPPLFRMDNRALDGFIKRFLKHPCPPSCADCDYCAAFARRALGFDDARRTQLLQALTDYHDWLTGERE